MGCFSALKMLRLVPRLAKVPMLINQTRNISVLPPAVPLEPRCRLALPLTIQAPAVLHGIDGRYATALFTAATKKTAIPAVEADLANLSKFIRQDANLRDFLENPTQNRVQKKKVVSELAKKQGFSATTSNLLELLAENGRLAELSKIIDGFQTLMMASKGEVLVTVTTAKVSPLINSRHWIATA